MFALVKAARRSIGRLFMLPAAAFALAACDPAAFPSGDTGQRIDTSRPVQVALLVPGGSAREGDNTVARSLENAARLALADLGGVSIDLRVYNTAGQAAQAAAVATEAVNDGASIILGPVFAAEANAAGAAVAGRNVNVLSFSNNAAIAGGNIFVLGLTFDNIADRLVSHAVAQGRGNIAIIHGQSSAEEVGRDAIRGAIQRNGATLAGVNDFPLSQQGVVAAARDISQQVRSSGAQAVFLTSGNDGALPLLAQLLPENGLSPEATQYIGLQRWDIPSSALSLPGLQGGWFAMPDQALAANFAARYQSAYGSQPMPITGLAYDGIAAVGALIATGNANALTTEGLTRGSGFAGVNGVFRFNRDGTNQRGLAIATIRNNQVIEVDPAPRRFGGAGF
ncbi:MAG: penicillin-binding protein activator [Paracoccaceae bacterium]